MSVHRALLPLLFVASCTALLPVGARVADPMTRVPVGAHPGRDFPIVLMTGDAARVLVVRDLRRLPRAPVGSTYLIPPGREDAIAEQFGVVLRVRSLGPQRQHVELYRVDDGYAGGAYEATPSTVTPLYRKITGPGLALVFGGVAFLINAALWLTVATAAWLLRR